MSALLLFMAIILVSLNPVWIQLALWEGSSPLALIFWQAVFAASLFLLYALWQRRLFSVKKGLHWPLLSLGLGFFLMALCFTLSLQRLSASYTVMLFFSYPFFVLLGNALLFKAQLTRSAIVALLVLFSGVLVITWPQGGPEDGLGILLALGAALAHAYFILFSGRNAKHVSSLQVAMFAQFGFFAAALLLAPFLSGPVLMNPAGMKFGLILAVLSSFIGFIMFVYGVAGLGANRAALFSVSNLPLSLLFSWLFLADTPGTRLLLGFVIILAGLLLEASRPSFIHERQP